MIYEGFGDLRVIFVAYIVLIVKNTRAVRILLLYALYHDSRAFSLSQCTHTLLENNEIALTTMTPEDVRIIHELRLLGDTRWG